MLLDGTQWSIDIEYEGDHKPVHIDGSNAFACNFDDLLELLGMSCREDSRRLWWKYVTGAVSGVVPAEKNNLPASAKQLGF